MSEPVVASGADKKSGGVKPRVSYSDLKWLSVFEKFKTLPAKTRFTANGQQYILDCVLDDPHPPSLWLKVRVRGKVKDHMVRKGDPLIFDLTCSPR